MNNKRQLLIDTALTLFYANGINSIGINEILKVSGIAKKTLYSHFESKEALTLATLEQRHCIFIKWLKTKLQGATSNKEVIIQLFTALGDWFTESDPTLGDFHGCFFINSSAEFSDPNNAISIFCKNHKQEIKNIIGQYITKENSLLLDAICIMKEGAITTAYVTGDHYVASKCINILQTLACERPH